MTVKTVGYVRVSKDDQAKDVKSSLRDQKAAIAKKATVEMWFEDKGKSAFLDKKRPGFERLLAYCKANPAKGGEVWVRNAKRFSRKTPDETAHHRYTLKTWGWLVCYAEGDEAKEPTARAVTRVLQDVQAHSESVNRSIQVKDGKRGAAEQGFCTGKTPYGYLRKIMKNGVLGETLQHGDRKPPDTQVVYWPEEGLEQRNVEYAFKTYATGRVSTYGIAEELRKRDPRISWTRQRVCELLKTKAYYGTLWAYEGTVNRRNNHTPLVSRELWFQCQAVFYERSFTRSVNGTYLLSGLIQCGDCGGNIVCTGGKAKYRQYGCATHRRGDGSCAQGMSFTQTVVNSLVIDAIAKVAGSRATHKAIEAEYDRMVTVSAVKERRRTTSRRREVLEGQRNNIMRAIAIGTVTAEEASSTLQPIRDELEELSSEIQQLRFAEPLDAQREEVLAAAKDLPTLIANASIADARDLLEPWLESAVTTADPRGITLRIRRLPILTGLLKQP